MKHLTIKGKKKTSIVDLKNELSQLMNYEPTITIYRTYDFNFKCYINISPNDDYKVIDILRILVKHCSNFKMEIDENDYYERSLSSPYFIFSLYYVWDGKDLKRCFKDFFGSSYEIVNFILD